VSDPNIIARRSTKFPNSRILPGHACKNIEAMASSEKLTCSSRSSKMALFKNLISNGKSETRSLSGGISIGNTFRR